MEIRNIQYLLIAVIFVVLIAIAYQAGSRNQPIVFSDRDMLLSLWENYKKEYVDPSSFRTIDRQRNNITTSEGQSYTLLRAVWTDDKVTFDRSLDWTNNFLQREEDSLYSWLYGKLPNGQFGVLESEGGANTATDADTDIALALIFAYSRWGDENYLDQATRLLEDIWEETVIVINDTPYLLANNVDKHSSSETAVINPSYFSPYAYRIFARFDEDNPWEDLVDSSYDILNRSIDSPLDMERSAGLPPDWIIINKTNGQILAPPQNSNLTTNYSYDALRVPWRIALDYIWFDEPRARSTLGKMHFLQREWGDKKRIYGRYAHSGEVVSNEEPVAMYAGSLGYFMVSAPRDAKMIYGTKIRSNYNPDLGNWKNALSYYDDNWTWFGIALYTGLLPNLASSLPDEDLRVIRDMHQITYSH